jgi:uncharacterized SAM-binding protein YcdF (DUF218 family)
MTYCREPSTSVEHADGVAVLGGGMETRPFAAAEYYRRGLVPKVLVSNLRSRAAHAELLSSETTEALLGRLGVPQSAIEVFGQGASNTYEESLAVKNWASRNHAHRLLVPHGIFLLPPGSSGHAA